MRASVSTMRRIAFAALCPAAFVSGWRSASLPALPDELQDLLDVTELVDVPDGTGSGTNATLLVRGVDVQVVNGLGATDSANGTGNVIVGWGETAGPTDRTGSHHLIAGARQSWTGSGGVVVGDRSRVGPSAAVIGGAANLALTDSATVVGGRQMSAAGQDATAAGGRRNIATGTASLVTGGGSEAGGANAASEHAVVLGGRGGSTGAPGAVALGGFSPQAAGSSSVVLGGEGNVAADGAAVLGGNGRSAGAGEVLGDGDEGDDGDWAIGAALVAQAQRVGVGEPSPAFTLDAATPAPEPVVDALGDLLLGRGAGQVDDTEHLEILTGEGVWRVGVDGDLKDKASGFVLEREGAGRLFQLDGQGFAALGAEAALAALHLARPSELLLLHQASWVNEGRASWRFQAGEADRADLGFLAPDASFWMRAGPASVVLDPYQELARIGRNLVVRDAARLMHGLSCNSGARFGPTTAGIADESEYPLSLPGLPFALHAWGVVAKDGTRIAGSSNFDSNSFGPILTDLTTIPEGKFWFHGVVMTDMVSLLTFFHPDVAPTGVASNQFWARTKNSNELLGDVPNAYGFLCFEWQ